jgi:hypothetical protein
VSGRPWVAELVEHYLDTEAKPPGSAPQLTHFHRFPRPSLTFRLTEGGTASLEYLRVSFGDVPEAERQKVRGQLERYCGLDTEGMIWIVDALRNLTGPVRDNAACNEFATAQSAKTRQPAA